MRSSLEAYPARTFPASLVKFSIARQPNFLSGNPRLAAAIPSCTKARDSCAARCVEFTPDSAPTACNAVMLCRKEHSNCWTSPGVGPRFGLLRVVSGLRLRLRSPLRRATTIFDYTLAGLVSAGLLFYLTLRSCCGLSVSEGRTIMRLLLAGSEFCCFARSSSRL